MRALRVVLADEGTGMRSQALDVAERAGFDVVGEAVTWPDVVAACTARAADVVLVTGGPDHAAGCVTLNGVVPSVILAPEARAAKEYVASGASAIVVLDCDPDILGVTAAMAMETSRRLGDARDETERLRDSLETRKLVERAKGVLMQRLNVSEAQAYRKMQRASQEDNRKMRDIAESILHAERLYADEASSG